MFTNSIASWKINATSSSPPSSASSLLNARARKLKNSKTFLFVQKNTNAPSAGRYLSITNTNTFSMRRTTTKARMDLNNNNNNSNSSSNSRIIISKFDKKNNRTMNTKIVRATTNNDSASSTSSADDTNNNIQKASFTIGITWFFLHQLIGVANDVIMKAAGQPLSVAQVVFLRFFFATLTMLPVMLISGKESFKTDRLPLHFARSALLAMGIFLYCKGLTVAPIAVVTTLNFTIPLFTLVLARFVLKEKVDMNRWIGTVVGFLGVCVVLKPAGGLAAFNPSWLLILAAATMFSSLDVLNKVFVGRESFWAMIFYTALFTTLIFSPAAAMNWVQPTMTQYGALAALGAGANALLFCLLKSFSMVDASALAPFRYTELMLSAGVGWILFKEAISMNTILGACVIVPSTLYVVWKENQKNED